MFYQDIQTPRRSGVFLTDFEVFGYLMKHSFEFLIWLLKPFIILGEIQSKSSQNLMLIKIRYPNHRHGSDFLLFSLYELLMSLRMFVSLSMKKMAKKKKVTFNAGGSLCGHLLFKNPSPW